MSHRVVADQARILSIGFFLLLAMMMVSPVRSFVPASNILRSRTVQVASSSQRAAGDEPLPSINPQETAVLICKFQNDFATPGGKIYDTVKEVMEVTNMKDNSIHFVDLARKAGCTIVHCPISLQPVCYGERVCVCKVHLQYGTPLSLFSHECFPLYYII